MADDQRRRSVRLSVVVTVTVDPDDVELLDRIAGPATAEAMATAMVAEIESHLESVSYVTHVVVRARQIS